MEAARIAAGEPVQASRYSYERPAHVGERAWVWVSAGARKEVVVRPERTVRKVMAEGLRPMRKSLACPEPTTAPSSPTDGSPVSLTRERRRRR
jgi:hypothetical protein